MKENNTLVDSGSILSKIKNNKISILKPVVNPTELEASHLSIAALQNLRHVPSFSKAKNQNYFYFSSSLMQINSLRTKQRPSI